MIKKFRYFRWIITTTRSTSASVQASDFTLLLGETKLRWGATASVTNPGGGSYEDEEPNKLLDNGAGYPNHLSLLTYENLVNEFTIDEYHYVVLDNGTIVVLVADNGEDAEFNLFTGVLPASSHMVEFDSSYLELENESNGGFDIGDYFTTNIGAIGVVTSNDSTDLYFAPISGDFDSISYIRDNTTGERINIVGITPGEATGTEADIVSTEMNLSKWMNRFFTSMDADTRIGKSIIIIDAGSPMEFDGYLFTTGNDQISRDPISWTLDGSDDGNNWTILSTIRNAEITTDRCVDTQAFTLNTIGQQKRIIVADGAYITPIPAYTSNEADVPTIFINPVAIATLFISSVPDDGLILELVDADSNSFLYEFDSDDTASEDYVINCKVDGEFLSVYAIREAAVQAINDSGNFVAALAGEKIVIQQLDPGEAGNQSNSLSDPSTAVAISNFVDGSDAVAPSPPPVIDPHLFVHWVFQDGTTRDEIMKFLSYDGGSNSYVMEIKQFPEDVLFNLAYCTVGMYVAPNPSPHFRIFDFYNPTDYDLHPCSDGYSVVVKDDEVVEVVNPLTNRSFLTLKYSDYALDIPTFEEFLTALHITLVGFNDV